MFFLLLQPPAALLRPQVIIWSISLAPEHLLNGYSAFQCLKSTDLSALTSTSPINQHPLFLDRRGQGYSSECNWSALY
ncbi:hypothetical protein M378DRAFT_161417 [Amanita muscaria Koide BX008]|uniref:Uncharacterized protein n=1 Tax=Amanita muscaria (strain Koide BX008) TaxID=946122 RepID=A0A0C2TGU9_AMAMK|nr:hypothetical protein M378DRAFT_161417 [Amanita muscaria Koide BX008]